MSVNIFKNLSIITIAFVFLFCLITPVYATDCSHCWCQRPDKTCEHHTKADGTTGNPIENDLDCVDYCTSRESDGENWIMLHCDDSYIDWNTNDVSDPCFAKTSASTETGTTGSGSQPAFTEIQPRLQVPDFEVKFSNIVVSDEAGGQYITVPWLAQYIAAVYQYMVGVATILAITMMMYGGFRWIVAGGDAGKIGEAKKTITQAAIGLILALGSYTVLSLINPDLVTFNSLRLALIERQDFDWVTLDVPSEAVPGAPTTYVTGVASSPGSTGHNDVPHFSQIDKRWGDKKNPENLRWFGEAKDRKCDEKLSVGQGTIAGSGCMCTAVTMILAWYKTELNQTWDIDPVIFCTLLGCRGHVYFGDKFPDGPWGNYGRRKFTDVDELKRVVKKSPVLILGHPVIQYKENGGKKVNLGHYMVVTDYENGIFYINDPGSVKFAHTTIPEEIMKDVVGAISEGGAFYGAYEQELKKKGSTREKNKPRKYWFWEITPQQDFENQN